jgi:hypothetical protein
VDKPNQNWDKLIAPNRDEGTFMKKLLTAVGAVLTLSLSAIVFASPADNEAQTVAHAMVNRFVDSWNRADGVACSFES